MLIFFFFVLSLHGAEQLWIRTASLSHVLASLEATRDSQVRRVIFD